MIRHSLSQFDYKIFNFLNNLGSINALDWFFVIIAVYFAYLLAVIVGAYWFVNKDSFIARKAIILSLISGLLAREVFANIIRILWHRNRPYVTYQLNDLIGKTDTAGSFPSGHATAMFGISSVIFYYNRKLGWLMYTLSILTAFGRVIVGVHYPSDVFAGALIGVATGYLIIHIFDKRIEPLTRSLSALSDKLLPFTKSKNSGNIT